jgi:hypothetical protein
MPKKSNFLIDKDGIKIPRKHAREADVKRHDLVVKLINRAKKREAMLKADREYFDSEIDKFLAWEEKHYGQKRTVKGSVMLSNFAKDQYVERKVNESVEYDEKLALAKAALDECLNDLAEGARAELMTIVNAKFKMNRQGKVNRADIESLTTLNVKHSAFQRFVALIGEARSVTGSKAYLYFKYRDETSEFKAIKLSLADV